MTKRILIGTRKGTFIVEKNGMWKPRLAGHAGVGVNFVAARKPAPPAIGKAASCKSLQCENLSNHPPAFFALLPYQPPCVRASPTTSLATTDAAFVSADTS